MSDTSQATPTTVINPSRSIKLDMAMRQRKTNKRIALHGDGHPLKDWHSHCDAIKAVSKKRSACTITANFSSHKVKYRPIFSVLDISLQIDLLVYWL